MTENSMLPIRFRMRQIILAIILSINIRKLYISKMLKNWISFPNYTIIIFLSLNKRVGKQRVQNIKTTSRYTT